MVSPTLVAKSEATVAKILAAAEGLFLARNYAEVTMDQIAEKSGVTKGALYHHFSSKEELYLEFMHQDLAAKELMFRRAIGAGKSCRDRLSGLTLAYFELPRRKSDLIRLVRRDANVFPKGDRQRLVRAYQAALPELVEEVVRDGIKRGELAPADARLLAWQFVALVEVTLGPYADRVYKDTDKKLNHVLDLFFRGAAAKKRVREGAAA